MKPLHSIQPDEPVRRVTDWLISERWDKPVTIITVQMICEILDIGMGASSDIYDAMSRYEWIVWEVPFQGLNQRLGDKRGMAECPRCHSRLWHGELESVSQRKQRLEASTGSVSMLARDDEPIIKGV